MYLSNILVTVIATSPEIIKGIYKRYNDWILDYDRAKIDKVFKSLKD